MTTTLNPSRKKEPFNPVYRKIEADLRVQINSGNWRQGAPLPSRRELASHYGVEVSTVQKAIGILLSEGVLVAKGGSGTFVASVDPPTPGEIFSPNGISHREAAVPISRATVGVVGAIRPDLQLEAQLPEHWAAVILQAFDRSFSDEQGVTLHFQNRWAFNPEWEAIDSVTAASKLLGDGLSALMVALPRECELDGIAELSTVHRIPTVIVTTHNVEAMIPHVRYDVAQSGYIAASHLLRQGYTHLSLFAPFKAEFAEKRLIGIKQAFDKSGLPASSLTLSDCVDHGDTFEIDHDSVAFEAAPRFLSQKKEKWGIIAANDPCAYGLLAAASEMGLVAGKDFGLVGFDDRPHSRELGLTSVHPPVHQMGVEAGKLIRQALRGEALPLQVLLKSQIVARKSSPAL